MAGAPEEADPLLERIDAACADVGRDPTTLERTFGLLVDAPGWDAQPIMTTSPPFTGSASNRRFPVRPRRLPLG